MTELTAPPIGVEPEWMWRESRVAELRAAIQRYLDAGKYRPIAEWARELEQHSEWLDKNLPSRKKHNLGQLDVIINGVSCTFSNVIFETPLKKP